MRFALPAFLSLLMCLSAPIQAQAAPEVGKIAPEFSAKDINGEEFKLADYKDKVIVLEWHNPLCPFVKKHYNSNNMQGLQAYARSKNAVWIIINSSAAGKEGAMDAKQAKEYVSRVGLTATHYVLDPEGKIGHLYEAKVTPHMFVIDSNGILAYMGAIDDRPTPVPGSITGAKNYVREALDSFSGEKAMSVTSTQAYGCSVKYAN